MYKKILIFFTVIFFSLLAFIYREKLLELFTFLEAQGAVNPFLVACILITLQSIASPLGFPGTPITLVSGSIFGVWTGTLVAIIGNTIGSTLAFLLARYIFQDNAKKLIAKHPKIETYVSRLETKGLSTVLFLRLIPLFPFNIVNFLFGVTPLPLRVYVVGSLVGMIPGTFLFVYLGGSLRALSPLNIALSILGIIVLTLIGKYYEKRI